MRGCRSSYHRADAPAVPGAVALEPRHTFYGFPYWVGPSAFVRAALSTQRTAGPCASSRSPCVDRLTALLPVRAARTFNSSTTPALSRRECAFIPAEVCEGALRPSTRNSRHLARDSAHSLPLGPSCLPVAPAGVSAVQLGLRQSLPQPPSGRASLTRADARTKRTRTSPSRRACFSNLSPSSERCLKCALLRSRHGHVPAPVAAARADAVRTRKAA